MHAQVRSAAPFADSIASTPAGRRRATAYLTTSVEHIPAGLVAHQIRGAAGCDGALPLIELAERDGYPLDPDRIACPLRIVWGTADRLLPWPAAAAVHRASFPHADWVVLDDVGHLPQLDVPLEAAELILGLTAPSRQPS
jgi:pimeloyl-ACP methyl ester carboxylesterase